MVVRAARALAVVLMVLATGCAAPAKPAVTLASTPFGSLSDGRAVTRYTMTTPNGVSVSFIDYGGRITDVVTPDRDGRPGHVVLGFPDIGDYEVQDARNQLFFGALLGRYANWIGGSRFDLDGRSYSVPPTNPPNTIHGGPDGFHAQMWTVTRAAADGSAASATLRYRSPAGQDGFPGALDTTVTYTLGTDGAFTIAYHATTDADTVLNPSSHMNFNLAGAGSGTVLGQTLTVDADAYLPLDRAQLPLGPAAPVGGTPFDFRVPTPIGARIGVPDEQLSIIGGYDQYWILRPDRDPATPAIHVRDPGSGRTLDVSTTQPGVQIYTGSVLGARGGIGGPYGRFGGFTLETQHYPDGVHHPEYPSTTLRPGQVFDSSTTFRFGVDDS